MLKFNYFCIKEICGTNRALCSFKKYRKGKLPKAKNDIGVLKSCNVLLQYLLYKQLTNYLYVSILIKEISNVASLRIFLFGKDLSQFNICSLDFTGREVVYLGRKQIVEYYNVLAAIITSYWIVEHWHIFTLSYFSLKAIFSHIYPKILTKVRTDAFTK